MQLKHKHLISLLQENQFKIQKYDLQVDRKLISEIEKFEPFQLYKELGGLKQECPHLTKTWYYTKPNTIIILDDYLHFNRYRSITLRSPLYDDIAVFPRENFRRYCRNYEKECIKSGLQKWIWSNRESDFYFGTSEEPGDFSNNGSGGWKLRSYQDFLEDAVANALNFKIVRFSVYDNFLADGKLVRLDSILDRATHPLQNQLLNYVVRRMNER
jgi:hypothetical protein